MLATLKNIYRKTIPQRIRERMFPVTHPIYGLVTHQIQRLSNHSILSGPFEGMRFTLDNPHLIKLLGTYELEINPAIEKLREFRFTKIINIGAAEGYYTIGFARLWPEATIYALESDQKKRNAISKLAEDNAVTERVSINGTCTAIHLASSLNETQSTLIMCDVEATKKKY
jgi:hypothetical protein